MGGLNRRQWLDREVLQVIEYIKVKGKKVGGLIIWERLGPICIQDVCVTSVVVDGDSLYWADIDKRTGELEIRKTVDDLAKSTSCRQYLKECFEDMKWRDSHIVRS